MLRSNANALTGSARVRLRLRLRWQERLPIDQTIARDIGDAVRGRCNRL